jgi:hypothetical protein
MSDVSALKAAIELFYVPSQVRTMRLSPLPKGTPLLLRLAAGEAEAAHEAQEMSGRPVEVTRPAAIFFIEQILLYSDADSYRILGADHSATPSELRAHMALLLKWLHPDLNHDHHTALLARRVIRAWDQIKTPERRRLHDEKHHLGPENAASQRPANRLRLGAREGSRVLRKTRASRNGTPLTSAPRATHRVKKSRRLRGILGFFFRFSRASRHI